MVGSNRSAAPDAHHVREGLASVALPFARADLKDIEGLVGGRTMRHVLPG